MTLLMPQLRLSHLGAERRTMRLIAVGILLCCWAFAAGPASAQEEILSFESLIEVEETGALTVTERIQVRAEGMQIRRGIFRDFPTVRRFDNGLVHRTTFELVSVERDGAAEPHFLEAIEGGTRVFIGQADRFLQSGIYTYTITYRTEHQLGFFDDFDEVYWNATGNFWVFPILKAVATVRLPAGAQIGSTAAFTGRFGSDESAATIQVIAPGTVRFEANHPLSAFEGLTVAASFQKGLVAAPSGGDVLRKTIADNAGLFVLIAGAVVVFAFMFLKWWQIGRDPKRGVVIPRFEPPRRMSPAGISYIHFSGHKGGSTGPGFMAALISLGTKGAVTLQETDGRLQVHEERDFDPEPLPSGEHALHRALFALGSTVEFNRTNGRRLMSATSRFRRAISEEFSDRYFKHNSGWTILAVVLAIVSIFLFLVLFPATDVLVTAAIAHFLGGVVAGFALVRVYAYATGRAPGMSRLVAFGLLLLAAVVLFALVYVFHLPSGGQFALPGYARLIGLAPFAMGASASVFHHLLYAPTEEGQRLMEEIEGFKLYLSVAEADRMNMQGAPDFSLDLFERFLPYAIGLKVEKPWSEALEGHLAKIPVETRPSYRPRYYSGSGFNPTTIAASTAAIASTISSAYAASMPKSSGSSSSGGGSSGGGGGGGGGGGW